MQSGGIPSRLLFTLAAAGSCIIATQSARAQATMADLVRVSRAKGDDYRALRDDLLQRHPQKWDVAAATAHSWEAGIAALAFNARLKAPETIAKWELRPSALSARGTSFDITPRNADIAVPWQLESLWQAPDARPKLIWNFDESFHSGWQIDLPVDLWLSVWDNAAREDLRKVAIYSLAVSGDPSTSETIVALLNDRASEPVFRYVCLLGLRLRDTQDTTSLVLDAWDAIVDGGHVELSIIVLAAHGDPAGRARLHEVADDPAYTVMDRVKSVVVLGSNPQPGDAERFVRFLSSDVAVSAKKDALYRAKRRLRKPRGAVVREPCGAYGHAVGPAKPYSAPTKASMSAEMSLKSIGESGRTTVG